MALVGPEYILHWMSDSGDEVVAAPCRITGLVMAAVWSEPALTVGAPAERGPSLTPVVATISKFVMPILRKLSKQPAGQRSSGVTEMEKKLPLSATSAPYFFK